MSAFKKYQTHHFTSECKAWNAARKGSSTHRQCKWDHFFGESLDVKIGQSGLKGLGTFLFHSRRFEDR